MAKHIDKNPDFTVDDQDLTRAVVCFLVQGDKVLLGLRKKVSHGLGHNRISGIGGKVGDEVGFENESNEDALKRELLEEINIEVVGFKNMGRVRFVFASKPKWNQDVQIYVCTEWRGDPSETDVIRPIWYPKAQLPVDQMWEDNKYWLERILAGEIIDAVFFYGSDDRVEEYVFF